MEKLLYVEKVTDTKYKVNGVHNFPNTLPKEVVDKHVLVNVVEEPLEVDGKDTMHFINPITKEQWYEYVDRSLTIEEELEILKTENAGLKAKQDLMQQAIDDLLLVGGAL